MTQKHHPHGRGHLMLVLTRKAGETIVIDGGIRITISAIDSTRVKVGVEAPRNVRVDRGEVAERVGAGPTGRGMATAAQ